jgi:hypothetical protein
VVKEELETKPSLFTVIVLAVSGQEDASIEYGKDDVDEANSADGGLVDSW